MDNVLCCSHNPQLIIYVLALSYDIKDGSVGPPTIYLGVEINKYQVKSGKSHWITLSTQYVNNTINTAEVLLKDEDRQLIKFKLAEKQPLPNRYRQELD